MFFIKIVYIKLIIYISFIIRFNKSTHSVKIKHIGIFNNNTAFLRDCFLFIRRPRIGFYHNNFNNDNSDLKLESIKHYTQRKAKNSFYDGSSGFVDYYKILSLDRSCSADEVRSKYENINKTLRSLPGVDPKLRSDIDAAYKTLTNKKSRDEYDKSYDMYSNGEGVYYMDSIPGLSEEELDGTSDEFEISIIDDDKEEEDNMGSGFFGNLFSNLFGRSKQENKRVAKPLKIRVNSKYDVTCNADIDLKTLLLGGEVLVPVRKWVDCNFCNFNETALKSFIDRCTRCNGKGMEHKEKRSKFGFMRSVRTCMNCQGTGFQRLKDCNKCENSGRILKDTTVKVNVPFNAKVGSVITIKGQGHSGGFQTRDGNLHIKLKLKENKNEYIEAGRIVTVYHIPYTKAILGAKVTVTTFMGDKQVEIPEYSQQGDEIKIGTYKNMDHYVKLNVQMPKNLSKSELEMLNKIDKG